MNYAPTAPSETPDLAFLDPDTRIERAEAALAEERSISSAILDTVPALVVVLDPEFKIVRFNKSCEVSTGYVFISHEQRRLLSRGVGVPAGVHIDEWRFRSTDRPAWHTLRICTLYAVVVRQFDAARLRKGSFQPGCVSFSAWNGRGGQLAGRSQGSGGVVPRTRTGAGFRTL